MGRRTYAHMAGHSALLFISNFMHHMALRYAVSGMYSPNNT